MWTNKIRHINAYIQNDTTEQSSTILASWSVFVDNRYYFDTHKTIFIS